MRMEWVLVKGEPQGSPFFVRVLCGSWRRLRARGAVFQTGLPLWARIRGFENPRLLRDRPTDGAAWAARIYEGLRGMGDWPFVVLNTIEGGYDHAGQSFRLACPCGQESEGLKTPGY